MWQILQADSTQPDVWNLLAMIHFRTNRPGSAIEHLQRAIELRPGQAILHTNLGRDAARCRPVARSGSLLPPGTRIRTAALYGLDGPGNRALPTEATVGRPGCFDRAIELKPDGADAHRNRGLALLELRRFDDAIRAFSEVLRRHGGSPWRCLSWTRPASPRHWPGRPKRDCRTFSPRSRTQSAFGRRTTMGWGSPTRSWGASKTPWRPIEAALAMQPDFVEALGNLGNALRIEAI